MSSEGIFSLIEDEEYFVRYFSHVLCELPDYVRSSWNGKITISEDEIRKAFHIYKENIKYFSSHLKSKSPDESKRASALLLAFCDCNTVCSSGVAEITNHEYQDGQGSLPYAKLANEYAVEMIIFNVCYCCAVTYRPQNPRKRFSSDYYENIYSIMNKHIRTNDSIVLNLDSVFLIFKSILNNPQ